MRAVAKNMAAAADLILGEVQQREKQQHNKRSGNECCDRNIAETPLVPLPHLPCGYSHFDAARTAREASTMV